MPGAFPGALGVAAFVGVKFGGYVLAGLALKKIQPTITAPALKIAAVRTVSGLILGPLCSIGFLWIADHVVSKNAVQALPVYDLYILLGLLRIFVWALIIYLLTRHTEIPAGKLWALALAGAVWSCVLDIPGFYLAMISPGRIPIC
jgi:hypothetical protein